MTRGSASSYKGWWLRFVNPAGWRGEHMKTGDTTPRFHHKRQLIEHIDEREVQTGEKQ